MTQLSFAGFLARMKMKKRDFKEAGTFLLIGLAVCAVLIFTGCSNPSVPPSVSPPAKIVPIEDSPAISPAAEQSSRGTSQEFAQNQQRPGLGTGWGKRIRSSLGNTSFTRESDRPFGGVAVIYYNDREGVEALAGPYKNKTASFQPAANGAIEWGVKSGWGSPEPVSYTHLTLPTTPYV